MQPSKIITSARDALGHRAAALMLTRLAAREVERMDGAFLFGAVILVFSALIGAWWAAPPTKGLDCRPLTRLNCHMANRLELYPTLPPGYDGEVPRGTHRLPGARERCTRSTSPTARS
jgi:hypothetical protein